MRNEDKYSIWPVWKIILCTVFTDHKINKCVTKDYGFLNSNNLEDTTYLNITWLVCDFLLADIST